MSNPSRVHPRSAGRRLPGLAALCLLLLLAWWGWSRSDADVVFETRSDFGRIRVTERGDGLRSLITGPGRARQSAVYPGEPRRLELEYSRVATVGLALAPADGRILYVGLGGGAMPMHARSVLPDARVEVVEIDPAIVEVARRFFGFRPDSQMVVHTGDGRAFIERAPPASYDLIVLDAFSDDDIPFSLTTWQFLAAVRAALSPRGVVVSNLWSSGGGYAPMVATYDSVFAEVRLIRVPRRAQRILVATSGARDLDERALVEASRALARGVELGFDLPALVERGYEGPPRRSAPVLDDRMADQGGTR